MPAPGAAGLFRRALTENCGNCDVCLDPPETYDATVDAQKALSCVFRVGQRFGVGHVLDVLRGARTQRILELGHDKLSTYGIGADHSAEYWGSLFRQLVHLGYLRQDVANYSVLKLTEAARPLLRGEQELVLSKPRLKVAQEKKAPARKAGQLDYDPALFENLRSLRKRIADDAGVPPYVVFGDAALAEMAAYLPEDPQALLQINGVGKLKLQRYGEDFLEEIRSYLAGQT